MGSKPSAPNVPQWIDEFWSDLNSNTTKRRQYVHDYGLADFFGVKDDFSGSTFDTKSTKPVVFARQQTSANEPCGSWLHTHSQGYAGAFHHDFAVAPEWGNAGKELKVLIVPPGIRWVEGVAAAKHTFTGFWPGGATQVYLPANVVAILDKATQQFCKEPPNKQTYDTFLINCKEAFQLQTLWMRQYDDKCQKVQTEALFYNQVRQIMHSCSKVVAAVQASGDAFVNGRDIIDMHTAIKQMQSLTVPKNVIDAPACKRMLDEHLQRVLCTRTLVYERIEHATLIKHMIEDFVKQPECCDSVVVPKFIQTMLTSGSSCVSGCLSENDKTETWLIKELCPGLSAFVEFSHTEQRGNTTIHWFRYVFR